MPSSCVCSSSCFRIQMGFTLASLKYRWNSANLHRLLENPRPVAMAVWTPFTSAARTPLAKWLRPCLRSFLWLRALPSLHFISAVTGKIKVPCLKMKMVPAFVSVFWPHSWKAGGCTCISYVRAQGCIVESLVTASWLAVFFRWTALGLRAQRYLCVKYVMGIYGGFVG